jgi:hypothetical protein
LLGRSPNTDRISRVPFSSRPYTLSLNSPLRESSGLGYLKKFGNLTSRRNAERAQEVLFKGPIPQGAIRLVR